MLKKEFRLKKKYQFNYCYRVGKSLGGKYLVLYYCPSKNKNVKVGISISKKVGGAIIRNRYKRKIRACLAPLLTKIKPNYNMVIIAKTGIVDAKYQDINKDIISLIKKSKLFDGYETNT